jgi:hypothetical protein
MQLTTYYMQFTTYYMQLTTYYTQLTTYYMQRTTCYVQLTTDYIQYRVLLRKEARLIHGPWGTSGLVDGLVQGSATTPIITPWPQSRGVICLVSGLRV